MSSPFRVEIVHEGEIPKLTAMMVPSFASYSVEQALGNFDTPDGIDAATQRHLRAAREHMQETGRTCGIKCVEATSGSDKMVACAYWYVFDRPRSPEDSRRGSSLLSADWLPEGEPLQRALKVTRPVLEKRAKWTNGRGHAILMYMATDPHWRRQGAATTCVKWGLDLCERLSIPAYLEASEQGAPVYQRLGFETVDQVNCEVDGEVAAFPAMIWWPTGTKEEDKRPLGN